MLQVPKKTLQKKNTGSKSLSLSHPPIHSLSQSIYTHVHFPLPRSKHGIKLILSDISLSHPYFPISVPMHKKKRKGTPFPAHSTAPTGHHTSYATGRPQTPHPDSAAAASCLSTRNPSPRIPRTPSRRRWAPRWGAGSPRSIRRRRCAGAGTGSGSWLTPWSRGTLSPLPTPATPSASRAPAARCPTSPTARPPTLV